MQEATKEEVKKCLLQLGIQAGDGLLIHSAVQFLGRPIGGIGMYWEAIREVVTADGTAVVPTFNFDFANGTAYDPVTTPAKGMGVFSEWFRKLPEAHRSPHPLQSIAAIGRYAKDLTDRDTPSAFGKGSAFERMYELNFKLLLLGADSTAVSMFHFCEQRVGVPYRYWKDFSGKMRTPDGWENRTYKMYVRDLELNPILTLEPVVNELQMLNEWRSVPLNYGQITSCSLRDFTTAAEKFLRENPWSLVTNIRVGVDGRLERLEKNVHTND